ncbi:MAG TPA: LapA family protein [Acidimicrobiales bacterium]|jgi:uncharacterized integral membrane protein
MTDTGSSKGRPSRVDTRMVLMAAAAILLLWFALANLHSVQINFWVTSTKAPLFAVIVLAAALGGFVAWLVRRRGGSREEK